VLRARWLTKIELRTIAITARRIGLFHRPPRRLLTEEKGLPKMTVAILLSQIGDAAAFAARVAAFRKAKLDHQNTVDVPAPREHELVEACVRRVPNPHPGPLPQAGEGVAQSGTPETSRSEFSGDPGGAAGESRSAADDYEIVDYEIIDDRPSLRARKDGLIHQISEQERALMIASMAPGKRRLAGLRAHEIQQKPEAERSDADKQFVAEMQTRLDREVAIGRHAAEQMAAIEDLTEDTIDAWQPAPFPGISDQESAVRNTTGA
jgi:hypothetical protein